MVLNLFSIFDPYMGILIFNWISTIIVLLLLPQFYWIFCSRFIYVIKILVIYLWKEYVIVISNRFNMYNLLIFITLFIYIIINNFIGLFPYIFTVTSHLRFSLRFSLSLWIGSIIFGWFLNTQFIFIHLVPIGTPFILIFFIVLIETLSNIIRPLTLAIRLVANIIAGHLLLTLLRRFIPRNIIIYIFILLIQLLLLLLEIGVSIIQAYVFVILIILYLKETN